MKLLAGILLALPLFAGQPFTIEQVLSAPFPSDMLASPHGDAVTWAVDDKGIRNVWAARAPDFKARQITRFNGDDGQEISEFSWNAQGAAVTFTRGQGANGRGEFPNPRSNPAGVQQEVWTASFDGEPKKLGDGSAAMISPDGNTVAWVLRGQIWSASLDGKTKPAQLIHARGSASELFWSPDGTRLAFTSFRVDHGFIGVYDTREKTLHFLDPSVDRDRSPVWSPDGKQIAFIRIPASRYAFAFGPKRTAQPWSIRVADAVTGAGREIWKAQEGAGSEFWPMVAENDLFWSEGDRIVFPWEGDGWLHLYSVASHGGEAIPLTPGDFEIEHAALSVDRKSVEFSANKNDIDRRHLWRVSTAGGELRRITSGSGIEWAVAPLGEGRTAILHSDAKLPSRPGIVESNGTLRDLTSIPASFPAQALVAPQPVVFSSADGMQIHGQLFLPPNQPSGKHPAVIFFHGGSRRQMMLGWHNMFYYHQAYGFNEYLASRGYVVLSVNYRSGIGYGTNFREALNYGATGASEFNDVLGAGLYMRGRPDVDGSRIGLWGGSYGGYLTALGLSRASNLFAAGVDLHGVHDWNLEISNFVPAYDPAKRVEVARIAFESSPLSSMETWKSPVLLIQGDDDRNVPFSESVLLAEALRKQHVYFEQLIFPDDIHDFLLHEHWLEAYNAADKFLAKFLKPL